MTQEGITPETKYVGETDEVLQLSDRIRFTDEITVELVKTDFNDGWVTFAARTSTKGADTSPEAHRGLIRSLMKNKHGTPFEHMNVTWRVTAPLFVWREHHRHRIGFSYNEESGRYKKLDPHFYVPGDSRLLVQTGKAMDYEMSEGTPKQKALVRGSLERQALFAYEEYEMLLEEGITREVARAGLPLHLMSTCIVTTNARSLMHFLSLRTQDERATFPSKPMHEINVLASGYEKTFEESAPLTYEAFNDFGRVSP